MGSIKTRAARTQRAGGKPPPKPRSAEFDALEPLAEKLLDIFATPSVDFALAVGGDLPFMLEKTGALSQAETKAAVAMIEGVKPRDEVEATLVLHMYITHRLAFRWLTGAPAKGSAEQIIAELSGEEGPSPLTYRPQVTEYLRTFAAQAEALAKLQSRPVVRTPEGPVR
jgi:hypothetical protein